MACKPMRQAASAMAFWMLVACGPVDDAASPDMAKSPGKAPQELPADAAFADRVEAALELGYGQDPAAADHELTSVIEDPRFVRLPASQRREALSLAAYAANSRGEPDRAQQRISAAIDADPGTPEDWLLLSFVESRLDHADLAAEHLVHFMREWPEQLDKLDVSTFFSVMTATAPDSPARLALLQTAFDANFSPKGLDMSEAWYELALLHLAKDDAREAAGAIARITAPILLVKLRSDRRFDALIDPGAPRFDVERAAAAEVARLRARADSAPDDLERTATLLFALMIAGETNEVLDITTAVLARTAGDAQRARGVTGLDQLSWIRNLRASALNRLGRFDDALAQMELASELDEMGQKNVSQVLNLAAYYAERGRADDALATIAKVGTMSGYGRMVLESIRLKATRAKGSTAGATAALTYLREHGDDAPMVLVFSLVEADQLDEAAAALISMLGSPAQRGEALLWLQELREPSTLPGMEYLDARWKTLKERLDVRAAIDAAGRIQRYAIYHY